MSVVWAFIVWVRRLSAGGLGRLFKRHLFAREELRDGNKRVSRDKCRKRGQREMRGKS